MDARCEQPAAHCQCRQPCRNLIRDVVCAFGIPSGTFESLRVSPFSRLRVLLDSGLTATATFNRPTRTSDVATSISRTSRCLRLAYVQDSLHSICTLTAQCREFVVCKRGSGQVTELGAWMRSAKAEARHCQPALPVQHTYAAVTVHSTRVETGGLRIRRARALPEPLGTIS